MGVKPGHGSHGCVAQERFLSNLSPPIIYSSVTGMADCAGGEKGRIKTLRKSGESLIHLRPIEVLQQTAPGSQQSSTAAAAAAALTRSAGTSDSDVLLDLPVYPPPAVHLPLAKI